MKDLQDIIYWSEAFLIANAIILIAYIFLRNFGKK